MLQNYRIGCGSGMLIANKNIADSDLSKLTTKNQETMHVRQRKLEILSLYLDSGNSDEFNSTLDELTSNLLKVNRIHDTYAQELYYSIAIILLSYINKWKLTEKIPFKIGLHKLMEINEHGSFQNAVEYLKKLSYVLFDMQSSEEEKRAQSTINKVLKYINDNISEDLSLVKLADLVYFNPSYLSRLFKSVVGENLSDYIYEVKIRKSKELLENTQLKIHEIAASMGYYSTTNFIRFFKKLTNITPQDYRDSIIKK
jgi:two-component system response regulator YesN